MKRISLSEVEVNDLLDLYQSEIDRAQRRINNLKTIVKKLSEGHSVEPLEEKPTKVKGKRGRKPQVKVVKTKVLNEEKALVSEPKKRGRKKKIVETKVVSENKISNEKIVEVKATPKKRGRKKKVLSVKAVPEKTLKNEKVIKVKATPEKKSKKKKGVRAKAAPPKRGRKPKSLRKPIKGGKGENKVKWNDFIVETITSKDSLMLASSLTQAALEKFEIPNSDRDRVRMAISTTLTKMANKDKVLQTYSQKGIRGAFFGLATWFNEKAELNNDYKKKLM